MKFTDNEITAEAQRRCEIIEKTIIHEKHERHERRPKAAFKILYKGKKTFVIQSQFVFIACGSKGYESRVLP